MKDCVQVLLHIDLNQFAAANKFYITKFTHKPPVRVCIQSVPGCDIGMSIPAVKSVLFAEG